MWSFQYKNGDRPLEGYTIQRAAGRGGFGEVYYALSDSGREVALKVVQGYEQIELRGISQCMNLKSPHLVTIFDVKYNAEGRPFVIMEYVSGPNLRQLLDEAPAGLGTQKAAFFLREMGKGLTFLHECGIVHRDLKPGNVFFENGYVKIGDYGLSKAISPTQHSGQTVTVGTVHYMAPEIGAGKYDRSIDIYAMGAVLYEMLTGTVPFIGASPSEILMKHLSAEPDMSGVPEPFNTVIRKAMAKDPAQRYQSIQEMVEAVFGTEHVRMSVSHFSPDDLSMVAGRVAQKVAMGGGGSNGGYGGAPGGGSSVLGGTDGIANGVQDRLAQMRQNLQDSRDRARESVQNTAERVRNNLQDSAERIRDRFGGLGIGQNGAFAANGNADVQPESKNGINDSLAYGSRRLLGLCTAAGVAVAAGILSASDHGSVPALVVSFYVFMAICSASFGLVYGWRHLVIPKLANESPTVRKLAIAGIVSASMLIGSGIFWLPLQHGRFHDSTWLAILAPLCLCNTWDWARANRKERVTLGPAIGIGFFGFILSGFFNGDPMLAIAVLAGTALVVQTLAPWDPALAKNRGIKGNRQGWPVAPPMKVYGNVTVDSKEAEAMRAAGTKVYGNLNISDAPPAAAPVPPIPLNYPANPFAYRHVPGFAPYVWLGAFMVLLTVGLMCLIGVASDAIHAREAPPFIGIGCASCLSALFCFIRIFKRRFVGWWSYLVRPLIMLMCANAILISSVVMGNANRLRGDEMMIGVFWIVFPALLFIVLPFLPRRFGPPPLPKVYAGQDSPHNRGGALGLAMLWFCGAAGIHRFYVGKVGTGILWLLTGGLLGIGQLIDVILICTGQFTDSEGRVLRLWDKPGGSATAKAAGSTTTASTPPPIPPLYAIFDQAFAPVKEMFAARQDAPPPATFTAPRAADPSRAVTGGFLSVITTFLVILTLVISLAIGLDLPSAVASGLPDAQTAADIRRTLFGDSQMWQLIVTQLLWAAGSILAVITLLMMMAARRRTSFFHILRGLLGIAGLLFATFVLTAHFNAAHVWTEVGQFVSAHQNDHAVEAFFGNFRDGRPLAAGATCLAANLLMAIPYRRRVWREKDAT